MPKTHNPIPSGEMIRQVLATYALAELRTLAEQSGVPYITLFKIRRGNTPNPGVDTVHKFWFLTTLKKGKK